MKTVDIILTQTQDYWRLSSIRTGRLKDKVTFEKFISRVNDLEFCLGPQRPLRKSVKTLSEIIIAGKPPKPSKPATITLLRASVNGGTI